MFKVARTKNSLAVADFVRKPVDAIMEDKFHGAYALLTDDVSATQSAVLALEIIKTHLRVSQGNYGKRPYKAGGSQNGA